MRVRRSSLSAGLRVILAAMILAATIASLLRLRAAEKELEEASAAAAPVIGEREYNRAETNPAARFDREGRGDAQVRELASRVSSERMRFYAADEITPSDFAAAVSAAIRRHGLLLERLSAAGQAGSALFSYVLSGSARDVMAFLFEVSQSQRFWNVPYFHLASHAGRSDLELEIQVSPALADARLPKGSGRASIAAPPGQAHAAARRLPLSAKSGLRRRPADEVATLFGRAPTSPAAHDQMGPAGRAAQLRYVAFLAAGSGARSYVFKELSTGRIIVVSKTQPAAGFRLTALLRDGFLLEKEGVSYLVPAGQGAGK